MVEISFEFKKRPVSYHYNEDDLTLTKTLAEKLNAELGDLLKGVILFGSAVRGSSSKRSDIDVLLLINDLSIVFSDEVVTSLRVIIQNAASQVSELFHITPMHLSDFWDYAKNADPVIVNILREGKVVYDEGFFTPMQTLLDEGKIRPTNEAVWTYYNRAPQTLKQAKSHTLKAVVDLYWGVIDAAHAALMHVGVVPGAPHEVAELLDKHFVKHHFLEKKYSDTLRLFYRLAKDIGHNKKTHISGVDFDKYYVRAEVFIQRMKFILGHDPSMFKKN